MTDPKWTRSSPQPEHVSGLPAAAQEALDEILERRDPEIVGVVLSGSAARGMATRWSDVDVFVVRDGRPAGTGVLRSAAVDEIPVTLAELERPAPFGTEGYWYRWSFAWARVLRDDPGGRVAEAVRRQATLTPDEQDTVLGSRLDGYVNFVYRALKADREGRDTERRLDAAESVPWLLDVVFALGGRVRPYNKYSRGSSVSTRSRCRSGRRRCWCRSSKPCSTATRARCGRCSHRWSGRADAMTQRAPETT